MVATVSPRRGLFPETPHPLNSWWGDTNAWDASEHFRTLTNMLAASPSEAATDALARLEADPQLASCAAGGRNVEVEEKAFPVAGRHLPKRGRDRRRIAVRRCSIRHMDDSGRIRRRMGVRPRPIHRGLRAFPPLGARYPGVVVNLDHFPASPLRDLAKL